MLKIRQRKIKDLHHRAKRKFTRTICSATALGLVLSSSIASSAFAASPDEKSDSTSSYLNSLPTDTLTPEPGKTSEDAIKNPKQPDIYTLWTNYKAEKGEEGGVEFHPYSASVGEEATPEEQKKVDKTIEAPELQGYDKPKDSAYHFTYDAIKKEAKAGKQTDFNYRAEKEFLYSPKKNTVRIRHVFQDLYNFNKYDKRASDQKVVYTEQSGNIGSTLKVQPLPNSQISGFYPEASSLKALVPEDTRDFEIEYRYNRQSYEVDFDTGEGTSLASRLLYYEQVIPTVEEPTRSGGVFLGWKPSSDITGMLNGVETTFKKDEIIQDAAKKPIKNLDAKLRMPSHSVTFTAVWQDVEKAGYQIAFWSEKADYDDTKSDLSLRDRYDFVGVKVFKEGQVGTSPDLKKIDIEGIRFPDLSEDRLQKAAKDPEFFAKFYFLNEDLTKKENASEADPAIQKTISPTGQTVYNLYFDRRVYTLYFTKIHSENLEQSSQWGHNLIYPTINRDGKTFKEGNIYHFDARFNQNIHPLWPKDKELKLPKARSGGDLAPAGWLLNVKEWPTKHDPSLYRDTPPYRLSAEDFLDTPIVNKHGGFYDKIPMRSKADDPSKHEEKQGEKYDIALGLALINIDSAIPHHLDFLKDDFKGVGQYDYDLYYWKSDTANPEYKFPLPHLQGFTLKEELKASTISEQWYFGDNDCADCDGDPDDPDDFVGFTNSRVNIDRKNITPFRSDADAIKFINTFGNPEDENDYGFGRNGHLVAEYTRNSYILKLNHDPRSEKNDAEYEENKDKFSVLYEYPLQDLDLDKKYIPERPDWVPNSWVFKGWAIDSAGKHLVKKGKETMPNHDVILYASWGEPDTRWNLTIDPAGGELADLAVKDVVTQEISDGAVTKEKSEGDKQNFSVKHTQTLKNLPWPTRKGYDFLGWEWVRYKASDGTAPNGEIDDEYRTTYGVPEQYPFGNKVVSDIYLKAIWADNARMDIPVYHHFIDRNGFEIHNDEYPKKDVLKNVRSKFHTSAVGYHQNQDWILVPHEKMLNLPDESVKKQYLEYNDRVKHNNDDFQTIRVEPLKITDNHGDEIPNPNVKNNVFHFYYQNFETWNYKVNYLDVRAKEKIDHINGSDLKAEEKKKALSEVIEQYKISDQESVITKNAHYDARNYRPIPGWVLASSPQQQLFYDEDETNGTLHGINGTGSDEITFYYRDARVIDVKDKNNPTPDGYVRVTFKSEDGGSFTDKEGNAVKEISYDVIKGLKFDHVPVPQELNEGEAKAERSYYISPEAGKTFVGWNNKSLLDKEEILENETADYYVFTAHYDWSALGAKEIVTTESFIDETYSNDFLPTVKDIREHIKQASKDGKETDLSDDAAVEIRDKDKLYEKFKELNRLDEEELVRSEIIKADVSFAGNSTAQELDIPARVYKNRYDAEKDGSKPDFLSDAEKGELKAVTGEYVKVTVTLSGKLDGKETKVYYVNPRAWVDILGIDLSDEEKAQMRFSHWTSDQAKQNEDHNAQGVFDFAKRHIFTEDTVISPVTQPAEPDKPGEPDKPSEPEKPAEPDKPDTPAEPDKPSEPSTPAEPEKPAEPMQPQVAQTPALSNTGGNLVFTVFGSFLLLTIGAVLVKKKGSRRRRA